mmetsp:Transcript_26075/g.53408  ORF Transcript_26075/g.53408 Transcript_26075/m.53408 type:complete len:218 (-) Transcript_26075:1280-1933(-)
MPLHALTRFKLTPRAHPSHEPSKHGLHQCRSRPFTPPRRFSAPPSETPATARAATLTQSLRFPHGVCNMRGLPAAVAVSLCHHLSSPHQLLGPVLSSAASRLLCLFRCLLARRRPRRRLRLVSGRTSRRRSKQRRRWIVAVVAAAVSRGVNLIRSGKEASAVLLSNLGTTDRFRVVVSSEALFVFVFVFVIVVVVVVECFESDIQLQLPSHRHLIRH